MISERGLRPAMDRPKRPMQWAKPWTWAVAGAVSLALFGVVATRLDPASLADAADRVSWPLVGAGAALLLTVHLFDAVRTHLIAGHDAFAAALRVTAWHSVWLTALPMRLGEVAWIVVMRDAYGWNAATAVVCALVQRLLDLAVMTAFLVLAMPAVFGMGRVEAPLITALAVAACMLALAGAVTLPVWLRLTARLVIAADRRRGRRPPGWRRRLLRHLLQGRRWLESVRHRRIMRLCLVPTALAWMAVFGSHWLLCRAVGLDAAAPEIVVATAGSFLVAALPVQSIGGFGLMEAGFTGILAWVGSPADTAAVAALTIRVITWGGTGLFWLISLLAGWLIRRPPAEPRWRIGMVRRPGGDQRI